MSRLASNESLSSVVVKKGSVNSVLLIGPKADLVKMAQIGLTRQDSLDDMRESEECLRKEAFKKKQKADTEQRLKAEIE